ncbi:MAG: carboxypeptidase-like regulatory domain-containing protein [Bacteroidota bacterium]
MRVKLPAEAIFSKPRLISLSFTFAFFLFLFPAYSVFAQAKTISGTVTDDETGAPVISANVTVKGKKGGTITDGQGNFTIQAAQGDVLQVSNIGYQTLEVAATSVTCKSES